MSTMKKHKKDYMDFIDVGDEDYNIMWKPHKRHSNAHNQEIVARVQELVLQPQKRSVYVEGDEIAKVGANKKAPELPEAPTNKEVWPPSSPDCNPCQMTDLKSLNRSFSNNSYLMVEFCWGFVIVSNNWSMLR